MGGRLKIEAVFSEDKLEINQFRKLKKTGGRIEGGAREGATTWLGLSDRTPR
jgi:hypothetical protein